MRNVFPEIEWDQVRFVGGAKKNVPSGYWKDKANIMKALQRAEERMGIKQVITVAGLLVLYRSRFSQPEDWYSVQLTELREIGFPSRVTRMELADLLRERYPKYKWEKVYLLRGRFAQQKRLERAVSAIFPVSVTLLESY